MDDRFVFGRVRNHEITFESLLSFPFCPWFPFFSISSSVFLPSFSFSFFYFYLFFPSSLLFPRLSSMLQTPRYSHSSLSFSSHALSLSLSRPLSVILLVRLSRSFALSLFSGGRQMTISQTAALFFPCFSCSSLH